MGMGSSSRPGGRGDPASRLPQRAPGTPADPLDDSSDYGGGNLVGSEIGGRDKAAPERAGATRDKDQRDSAAAKDQPIGSALASASGRNRNAPGGGSTAGAGSDLSSGSATLGATSGGERASAGRTDTTRSSRDHDSRRDK